MNKENHPIFIHSLFRTGSTYTWNKFRENPNYYCYYEPFHQVLAQVTPKNIENALNKNYQQVRHPQLSRYYLYEYAPLLENGRTGVPSFKKSFSFDEFCDNEVNPDQKKYIDYLMTGAGDKIPVFQFNRSALRVKWFKQNYPHSLNIYLVRNPRHQWQSYVELYNRTNYTGFFLMDLIIASMNKHKNDFLVLAGQLPLIRYNKEQQDKENNFYRTLLDAYSEEEKYFIFYYTWFRALVENLLNADFILNINLLSKESSYQKKVNKFLKERGIRDIDFKDSRITEYSIYTLPLETMEHIEENVRRPLIQSMTKDQINGFFQEMSPEDKDYFQFKKENFIQIRNEKEKNKTGADIREKTIEKFEKMILSFWDEWTGLKEKHKKTENLLKQKDMELQNKELRLKELKEQLKQKDMIIRENSLQLSESAEQLAQTEHELRKIRRGYTYRIGRLIVSPLKIVKRLGKKSLGTKEKNEFYPRQEGPVPDAPGKYEKKIDLSNQLSVSYGQHRSGWIYAIRNFRCLHHPRGILLDTFIERTFSWNPRKVKPHLQPWIGFIHVPPKMPKWFSHNQVNEVIFSSEAWKKSLPFCRGLFTLSYYHRKYLEGILDVPINHLLFPTEIPPLLWDPDRFSANKDKKIVQVGWWLRKLHAIYQLPLPKTPYKKIFLGIQHRYLPKLIKKEREILLKEGTFHDDMYQTVETLDYLPNKDYDKLLAENIVFVYLYDASANNTVIECIARNTPLLINPLEPVKEYLGEEYPLYYHSLEEAAEKAANFDLIRKTHQYLLNHPIKPKLTGRYFLESFANSPIYCNLNIEP